jgi:uncharacterized SAM-binding protein YcdF (DUF218 family)
MSAHSIWLVKNIAASLVLPPLNLFFVGGIGWLLLKRKPKLGKILIALSLILLFALSLPIVANGLMRWLEKDIHSLQSGDTRAAEVIVILGGGVYHDAPEYAGDAVGGLTLERLQYGAYLQRQTALPILVTGGRPEGGTAEAEMMQRTLEQEFKVPVRWAENRSLDTAQNAQFSAAILKAAGIRKILLVSHAWHLPRARIEFEKQGLTTIPAPTRFGFVHDSRSDTDIFDYLPQARALQKSYYALHEGIGVLWYKLSR